MLARSLIVVLEKLNKAVRTPVPSVFEASRERSVASLDRTETLVSRDENLALREGVNLLLSGTVADPCIAFFHGHYGSRHASLALTYVRLTSGKHGGHAKKNNK